MDEITLTNRRKQLLRDININNFYDLVKYVPYKYEDISSICDIDHSLNNKNIVVEAKITSESDVAYIRKNLNKLSFYIEGKNFALKVIIFNRDFLKRSLKIGQKIRVKGKLNYFKKEILASNVYINKEQDIIPHYKLPQKLYPKEFQKLVYKSFNVLENKNINKVPSFFIYKYKLLDKKKALYKLHFPTSKEDVKKGYRHLKYEEMLEFTTSIELNKRLFKQASSKYSKKIDIKKIETFFNNLPFKISSEQKRVVKEILDDIKSSSKMYRILQGDVGSGKTLVAITAMLACVFSSFQTSIMAPTDLLARQHFETISTFLKKYGINIELLVSKVSNQKRKEVLKKLKEGKTQILVGTHALIQEDVRFNKLGLAIIDEQHRFGVAQRQKLLSKGSSVELLLMSATPIPRTLAQSVYGNMDVSTIKGFAINKGNITTKRAKNSEDMILKINKKLKESHKIFIVCPFIDKEEEESIDVESIYLEYSKKFSDKKIAKIHGKVDKDERNKILEDFKNNKIDILVSTSVIEVGIDISDANVMGIYGANHFGLAQLHQIRGRIGRGGKDAFCFILGDNSASSNKRLSFFEKELDGFKISEFDMKNRGIGDILGLKQSGLSDFKRINIDNDLKILKIARGDAKNILDNLDKKEFLNYKRKIETKVAKNMEILS